jgi:ketosteroid isomerase-like protein
MTAEMRHAIPDDRLQTAQRLYEAFAAHDAKALLAVLTPGFRGVVSEGMPDGLGGAYEGAETMLRECWARVFALVDLRPVPAEFLPVSDDRIIVLGRYEGTARATGRPLSAAFAHMLRFAGGRVSELVQITDTARWRDALAP